MIFQGNAQYPVREVILHTSATGPEWWHGKTVLQMRDEIDRWHKDRGWKGIGYHYVVAPDGSVARGRALTEIGAHVKERNRGTIGICMIPVKEVTGITAFQDYYTKAQKSAVLGLIEDLADKTTITQVTGHNIYANKLCPGFYVRSEDWMPTASFWQRFVNFMKGLRHVG